MLTIIQALLDIGVDVPETSRQIQIHCPFHKAGQEVNPSARVYPENGSMYCFTCHRAYTPVTVIAAYHGITIPEAIIAIRERYGGTIQRQRTSTRRRLDNAIQELLVCIHTLQEPDRTTALSQADHILTMSARGDSESKCLTQINELFYTIWPTLVPYISNGHPNASMF